MSDEARRDAALHYHSSPRPGKLSVEPTKPVATQADLAIAYSPGVADACLEIVRDPMTAAQLTTRANLVAVVTNGTAVLGLGNIGPLAAKPVMEGKAVLFKKFAGIDVFDIELNEPDPQKFADIVAAMEPTFGAINLEDIAAPACFEVERVLTERMGIPVFHDDQHGTAIVVAAAVQNALMLNGGSLADLKIVSTGGGAAGIACLDLLVELGARPENVWLVDVGGLVHTGRDDLGPEKARYAQASEACTLNDVIDGANLFLGLSAGGILKPEMVQRMAPRPIVLALANPTPEIMPDLAREAVPDAIIATGRSDYPNQVNNVLCFPFIFRGALDVGATTVNGAMKRAAVEALASVARAAATDEVARVYKTEALRFGPEYLIPKPFDPRLLTAVASAVARAAMDSGVATRPIADFTLYRQQLEQLVYRSGFLMKPLFDRARGSGKRVVFAEGEDERVLRTVQSLIADDLAVPVVVGRPSVLEQRCDRLGLRIRPETDFEICNPESDPRYANYWKRYHEIMERRGVSPDTARTIIRTDTTAIAAIMVDRGEADAMVCGTIGDYGQHLQHVRDVIGRAPGQPSVAALTAMILKSGVVFVADSHVNADPTASEIVDIAILAAQEIRRFGQEPRAALIAEASFGSSDSLNARKMRRAYEILTERKVDFAFEGEMTTEAALDPVYRARLFPNGRFADGANLLIMPSLEAANTVLGVLRTLADGLRVGPILLGTARPAFVVTPAVTVRGLLNVSVIAASR